MRPFLPFLVAAGLWLGPGQAAAVDVFINGESVTGIRNVSLVNARVRIDERGDVHLDAPGYTVRRVDIAAPRGVGSVAPAGPGAGGRPAGAGAAAPINPPLARRYYLVTNQTDPGMAQYDLEILVNGTSVARARGDADPVIDLLNRHLRPGRNEVRIVARKNLAAGARRSESRNHLHRVLIGDGSEQGGQVSIETTLVDYSVNASQTEDQTAVFTITVR
jgi:hypothetical protein